MKLEDIVKGIEHKIIGNGDIEITGMKYDSRKVEQGDLFFCIVGFVSDGHQYAEKAVELGAACLVVEHELPLDVTQVVVSDSREAMALMAASFYGHPAKKLRMIGVTGTNGKTSTTYILKSIFEKEGSKVGLIGTITNMIGERRIHTERTTPESLDFQALLAEMVAEGVDTVVMEVSSHSLVLKRVAGIVFDGSIFTNLTQDHLDFHKTFEEYAAAKSILFANSAKSVINMDDKYASVMTAAAREYAGFAVYAKSRYTADDIELRTDGCRFVLKAPNVKLPLFIGIPGLFSVYNAMGAIALCLELGVELQHIKAGIEAMSCVPGRFETLDTRGGNYSIILDYAHTPDSLESTLKTVKGFAKGRVVCVFGCGGNRDNKKRPIMGEISGRLADFSIITSDNPRFEEPDAIIAEIEEGMKKTRGKYITIENRRAAIKYAIENAKEGDVIVLAGKGHEDYQEIRGVKHDFDEKVVVAEILDELNA